MVLYVTEWTYQTVRSLLKLKLAGQIQNLNLAWAGNDLDYPSWAPHRLGRKWGLKAELWLGRKRAFQAWPSWTHLDPFRPNCRILTQINQVWNSLYYFDPPWQGLLMCNNLFYNDYSWQGVASLPKLDLAWAEESKPEWLGLVTNSNSEPGSVKNKLYIWANLNSGSEGSGISELGSARAQIYIRFWVGLGLETCCWVDTPWDISKFGVVL